MLRRPSPSPAIVAAIAAVVAVSGGLAVASATSVRRSPIIRACANKKAGALRLASKCKPKERFVYWNQKGPVGEPGLEHEAPPALPGQPARRVRKAHRETPAP